MAKRKSIFDDKETEIDQLTSFIRQDIGLLNKQIAQLQEVEKKCSMLLYEILCDFILFLLILCDVCRHKSSLYTKWNERDLWEWLRSKRVFLFFCLAIYIKYPVFNVASLRDFSQWYCWFLYYWWVWPDLFMLDISMDFCFCMVFEVKSNAEVYLWSWQAGSQQLSSGYASGEVVWLSIRMSLS